MSKNLFQSHVFLKFELLTDLVLIATMKQTFEKTIVTFQTISLTCLKNCAENIVIFLTSEKLIN